MSKILSREDFKVAIDDLYMDSYHADGSLLDLHDEALRALVGELLKDLEELADWGDYGHLLDCKLIARAKEVLK